MLKDLSPIGVGQYYYFSPSQQSSSNFDRAALALLSDVLMQDRVNRVISIMRDS